LDDNDFDIETTYRVSRHSLNLDENGRVYPPDNWRHWVLPNQQFDLQFPTSYHPSTTLVSLSAQEEFMAINLPEVFVGYIAFGMADSRLSDESADRMALFWSAFTLGRIPPVVFNEIFSQLSPRANPHEQVRRVFRVCWLAHQHAMRAGYLYPTYQRVCMARRDLAEHYAKMIAAPGQKRPKPQGGSGPSKN
jgi:hypothetical protein